MSGRGQSAADPAAPTPLHESLPRIEPARARLARTLFRRPWLLEAEAEGRRLRLHLGQGQAPEARECVELQCADQLLVLQLAHSSLVAAEADAAPPWSDFVGRSRLLAWSLAHEPLVGALSALLRRALLPVNLACADTVASATGPWLAWRLEADGERVAHGRISLPVSVVELLVASAAAPVRESPGPAAFDRLRAALALELPPMQLHAEEAASLRLGAVVLLGTGDAALSPLSARLRGPGGNSLARFRVGTGRAGLALADRLPDASGRPSFPDPQEPPMAQSKNAPADKDTAGKTNAGASPDAPVAAGNPDPAAAGERPAGARALAVQLEFEVGRLSMPLEQARTLQPGYVFELDVPATGTRVDIRVHGHLAGRGELVRVGDVVGVRLTEWGDDGL